MHCGSAGEGNRSGRRTLLAVAAALAAASTACSFDSRFVGAGDGSASPDSSPPDSAVDAGVTDAAVSDSGLRDSGPLDSGLPDSGLPDSGPPDSGAPDSGAPDSGLPDSGPPDSGRPDSGAPDAGGPICDFSGTLDLEPPTAVAEVNSGGTDRDPYLSRDGLTLYFASDRTGGLGGWDIWMATRPGRGDLFFAPVNVVELNSDASESKMSISADGLTVYLSTSRTGGPGGSDVWTGTRPTVGDPFGILAPLANVNTTENEHDPEISVDGLTLFLAATYGVPPGIGGQDVVAAVRPSLSDPFAFPEVIPLINSDTTDGDPALAVGDLALLFASSRPGGSGSGDIYLALRPAPGLPFAAPIALPVINSADDDGDPGLSADGCELFFSSTRPGGAGGWDIWVARWTSGT